MDEQERTRQLGELSIKLARFYKGKINSIPNVPIKKLSDFSVWYTPGIASVSLDIAANREDSFELTGRWNSVAILTDGTRVLGLGNVGPEAAMPVMEGKALIFNYLGGVNAVPIPIKVSSQEEFFRVASSLETAFGGFNLEDIESPKCFFLLESLQKALSIPVWHDDQLGTASITLAGLINALKLVGKKRSDAVVALLGSGAANIATAHLLEAAGFKSGNLIMVDSKGILEPEREDMDKLMLTNPWKYKLAIRTNSERRKGATEVAFKGADVVVSASKSDPNFMKQEWIRSMATDPIVFALANPTPEIWPDRAKEAGAKIVATGRSDFPNQINNSLIFPAVFRGVLDARSRGVNFRVMVTASEEVAAYVRNPAPDHIVPSMQDLDMFPKVAAAVAYSTVEENLARKNDSREGFYTKAKEIIDTNRERYSSLLDNGFIKGADKIG